MTNSLDFSSRVLLNDGNSMPLFGLGVWAAKPGKEAYDATLFALNQGYRHIDTAELYGNEQDVGKAIINSGYPRNEIFVTTKLWESGLGYDHAIKTFEISLKKMNLEYIDLYLIHWPEKRLSLDAWRALEQIKKKGLCRSIGVSNFAPKHLKKLLNNCEEMPTVNQIELNPFLQQKPISSFCIKENIHLTCYCPLARGHRLNDPNLKKIATITGKTPAQIMLRWALQKGYSVIPKSTKPKRIIENANVFDFKLDESQMSALNELEEGLRFCPDPLKIGNDDD